MLPLPRFRSGQTHKCAPPRLQRENRRSAAVVAEGRRGGGSPVSTILVNPVKPHILATVLAEAKADLSQRDEDSATVLELVLAAGRRQHDISGRRPGSTPTRAAEEATRGQERAGERVEELGAALQERERELERAHEEQWCASPCAN